MTARAATIWLCWLITSQVRSTNLDLKTVLTPFKSCKILVHSFLNENLDMLVLSTLTFVQSPYNILSYNRLMNSSDWESIRDNCRLYIFNFNDQLPRHLLSPTNFVSLHSKNHLKAEEETDLALVIHPSDLTEDILDQEGAFIKGGNVLKIAFIPKSAGAVIGSIKFMQLHCKNYVLFCWQEISENETYPSTMDQVEQTLWKLRRMHNGFPVHVMPNPSIYLPVSSFNSKWWLKLSLRQALALDPRLFEVGVFKLVIELSQYLNFTLRFIPVKYIEEALRYHARSAFPMLNAGFKSYDGGVSYGIELRITDMKYSYFLYCKTVPSFQHKSGVLAWAEAFDTISWIMLFATIAILTAGCAARHLGLGTSERFNCQSLISEGGSTLLGVIGAVIGQSGNFQKMKLLMMLWALSAVLISINYNAEYKSVLIVGEELEALDTYQDLKGKGYKPVFRRKSHSETLRAALLNSKYKSTLTFSEFEIKNMSNDYELYEHIFTASPNKFITADGKQFLEAVSSAWVKPHTDSQSETMSLSRSICHIGNEKLFIGQEEWHFYRPNAATLAQAFADLITFGFNKVWMSVQQDMDKKAVTLEIKDGRERSSETNSSQNEHQFYRSKSLSYMLLCGLGISAVTFSLELFAYFIVPRIQHVNWTQMFAQLKLKCLKLYQMIITRLETLLKELSINLTMLLDR